MSKNNHQTNPALKLAEFLKSKRIAANLTQMDVARQFGYTTAQFISNWERGLSSPPVNVLKKLTHLYKVDPEELYEIVLEASVNQVKLDLKNKFFGNKKTKLSSAG